jgi:hypothetical protein
MAECRHRLVHERLLQGVLAGNLACEERRFLITMVLDQAREHVDRWSLSRKRSFEWLRLSKRDVVFDVCAELVAKNCTRLRQAMLRSSARHNGATSLCDCFHPVLEGQIRQGYARFMTEYHPTYARMQRSLRSYVKRSDSVRMRKVNGERVYYSASINVLREKPWPPFDLPIEITYESKVGRPELPVISILTCVLQRLAEQDQYRREVREQDVIYLTMSITEGYLVVHGDGTEAATSAKITDNEGRFCVIHALEGIRADEIDRYVARGKLTSVEAEAMINALEDMYLHGAPEMHDGQTALLLRLCK